MSRHPLRISAWIVLAIASPALSADGPEIVRVRVPSDRVGSFFPAGTEQRVMPREDFERLADSAKAAHARQRKDQDGPRLLRARHEAKFEDGALIGRSDFLIDASANPSAAVLLDPFTPALDPNSPAGDLVRVGRDGRFGLRAGAEGPSKRLLRWEQRARPGTSGRVFDLGLPAMAACSLTLDLPAALVPEIAGTLRQGPAPGSSPDRRSWRFDGPGGAWRVRLQAPRSSDGPESPVWVAGSTRIDASQTPARWRMDWTVDPGTDGPRRFGLALDRGLDLIDVSGPGVASYRAEPAPDGNGTVVTVRLVEGIAGPTPVVAQALARVPDDGPWLIPTPLPEGATWTGGRTVVRLGPSQVVSACRALSGRQITPNADEREFGASRSGLLLAFEATGPASPAELTLRRSPTDATAEVKGQIVLGAREAPRLDAQVSWRVDRGRLLNLSADLPAGWSIERAQIRGVTEATAWHSETRPGGGSRLIVHPPAVADPNAPIVVDVSAVSSGENRFARLELPRVVPLGVRVSDELWVARADAGMNVSPRSARGLVWIDPATVVVDPTAFKAAPRPASPRAVLAWRWTAADGRGLLARSASAVTRSAEAWTLASVTGDQILLDHYLAVDGRDRPTPDLVLAFSEADGAAPRWDVLGEPGRTIEATPIPPGDLAALGLPAAGSAYRLTSPRGGRDRVVLHRRTARRWEGAGPVPLLLLPDRQFSRGTLLVSVDRGLLAETHAPGLTTLDPSWAWAAFGQTIASGDASSASLPRGRPAQAMGYGPASASPRLRTETLPAAASGGLIQEATLSTRAGQGGRSLHRLVMQVVPGADGAVEVRMPEGASLGRALVGGRLAAPIRAGLGLRFTLPAPVPPRTTVEMELDYLGATSRGVSPRPERPEVSLPCLAFCWNVDLPPALAAAGVPAGLTPTDPSPRGDAASSLSPDFSRIGDRVAPEDTAALREMDARVLRSPPEGRTLGDWLARLDGGRVPIVVDREALDAAGWGPRTTLVARSDRPRSASASDLFASMGLQVAARGGCAVVSSATEPIPTRIRDDSGWPEAVRQAAAIGHDPTGRFRSVASWVGEITPGPWRDGRGADGPAGGPGETRRYVASGWPSPSTTIPTVDVGSRRTVAVAIGLAVAALGVVLRRSGLRLRGLLLGLALSSGLVLIRFGPRDLAEVASALLWGSLAAGALAIGSALRPSPRDPRSSGPRSRTSRSRIGGPGVAAALVASVAMAEAPARPVADEPPAKPIVALIPYDPPFDPKAPSDRVILRLEDFEILRELASAPAPSETPAPSLAGALHEIRREGPHDARVASAFDLRCDVPGPSSWSFPIEGSRDLKATLDGRDVPVRIGPGGNTASVEVSGARPHRVILRRLAALGRSAEGEGLKLPIPPVPSARLRAEVSGGEDLDFPGARGRIARQGTILDAALGPVDSLDVRWTDGGVTGPPRPRGVGEAVVLWDVEPAGDRVRARITARSPEGLDRLVIGMEPGLLVRSAGLPGVAEGTTRTGPSGTVWQIPIDPPLTEGQSVSLELWRPLPSGPLAAIPIRRLPRFEVLGMAGFGGLIGVRHPEGWTGRLGMADGDLVPDEVFARAWGAFPQSSATLAGAARFEGMPSLVLGTGPPLIRPRVKPSVRVEIAPGRLDVTAEAVQTEEVQHVRETDVQVPRDLRIVRVEAPGLTDWSRPGDDRIRLRFDSDVPAPSRSIRLEGWVPVDGDPMVSGPVGVEANAPWLAWPGADVETGLLTVAAPANVSFQLDRGEGVAPTVPPEGAAAPVGSAFSVAPLRTPGRIRWTVEPPGVSVLVQSLLTLQPASSEWSASARYQVPWGPCPPIRLLLPTEWADVARVEIVGSKLAPQVEKTGKTTSLTFRPDPPIWGGLQILVRATRPRDPARALQFPDLIPLGRARLDRVESYLGYADTSGLPPAVEGSAELQAVDASRWDVLYMPWTPASPRNVLRVLKDGWSLRFLPPNADRPSGAASEGAAVTLADVSVTLAEDGSIVGRASYELDGRPSAFLRILLPDGAEPLGANVDGAAVLPRRDRAGRLLVPLPERGASRAVMVWRGTSGPADAGGRRSLPLPTPVQAGAATLLSVSAPDGVIVSAEAPPVSAAALELARAEKKARATSERLSRFDRGSSPDRSALLSSLVRFELQARAAERAARRTGDAVAASILIDSLQATRATLQEALMSQGLEDFARSAQSRVGQDVPDPLEGQVATAESQAPLGIRPLGRASHFRADPARPLGLRWEPRARGGDARPPWLAWAVGLGGLLVIAPFALIRPRWVPGLVAVLALVAVASLGGGIPALGVLVVGMVAGRFLG